MLNAAVSNEGYALSVYLSGEGHVPNAQVITDGQPVECFLTCGSVGAVEALQYDTLMGQQERSFRPTKPLMTMRSTYGMP